MSVHSGYAARIPCAEFQFTSTDGLHVACARWDSLGPVRGVVQIADGMGEHIGRYVGTIEALVSAGLTVYGNDHRGHGRTVPSATHLGDFGEGGFDSLVEDMVRLSHIAKEEIPDRPCILFGHSMGSFAAQQYVLDHSTRGRRTHPLRIRHSRRTRASREFSASREKHPERPLRAGADPVRLVEPRQRSCRWIHLTTHCALHNFSPRPMHPFSELRGDCPIRSVFARSATTYPSTCFRAAKILWASSSKGSMS